jgi:hypothetical protein
MEHYQLERDLKGFRKLGKEDYETFPFSKLRSMTDRGRFKECPQELQGVDVGIAGP